MSAFNAHPTDVRVLIRRIKASRNQLFVNLYGYLIVPVMEVSCFHILSILPIWDTLHSRVTTEVTRLLSFL